MSFLTAFGAGRNCIARLAAVITLASLPLGGCIAAAPAEIAWSGAKLTGKGVYYSGLGLYHTGRLGVRVAGHALDGTETAVRLTVRMLDAAGEMAVLSYQVSAAALDDELNSLERNEAVLDVIVERLD